ncbi:MAG: hypothetical protein GY893_07240 [bacterium]|nr:hypothetical protein [bacterium]
MPRFKMVDGVSVQLTSDEETARDNEEAAWAAGEDARALAGMRRDRDRLIAETDFYALSDVTMSSDMATYRQALRDLPSGKTTKAHVDGATWPTKP